MLQRLRARLLDVAAELAPARGVAPAIRLSGLVDTLPDDLAEDLVAVMRRRAERRGGTLTPVEPTGTRPSWSIPNS